jgi:hypothetical protein
MEQWNPHRAENLYKKRIGFKFECSVVLVNKKIQGHVQIVEETLAKEQSLNSYCRIWPWNVLVTGP